MSEQWKSDGKCLECRRHGYCKTQCGANKKAIRRFILESLKAKMKEKTGINSDTVTQS